MAVLFSVSTVAPEHLFPPHDGVRFDQERSRWRVWSTPHVADVPLFQLLQLAHVVKPPFTGQQALLDSVEAPEQPLPPQYEEGLLQLLLRAPAPHAVLQPPPRPTIRHSVDCTNGVGGAKRRPGLVRSAAWW